MTNREKTEKLLEAYRHTTMLPATLRQPLRGALKCVLANAASVEHLKATISSMISSDPPYNEHSPIMANFKNRLNSAEANLVKAEEVLYGSLV